MREVYRILDANFNRAREALRVAEDCGRFALNDVAITAMAKNLRSDLKEVYETLPVSEFITSRDTRGDIGTEITSPTEPTRKGLPDVAQAACKRLTEALRTIEEYGKFVAPAQTLRIERMRYDAYTLEQRLIQRISIAKRFEQVKLYVLISARLCTGSIQRVARAALAGGADAVQLRETDVCDAELLALAAELRELTDETDKLLIINNRPDIAAIIGADGLHLGQTDLPLAEARRLLRPGAIVGRSTHNIDQARAAVTEGADYVAVGPIFETSTKMAGPPVGTGLIAQMIEEISLPVCPIGGISMENIDQVIAAGAKRIAVCSAVCCADDPKAAAQSIREKLE
ncbi:MAG: thiamine phosphate synthase [Planctomycetota bacterium]|jgi:thiamine-phosphate pyrophosphorylase